MAKRKKTTNQKESLFNTGAYSSKQTVGDFNNVKYDSGWDTGAAFPEIHKVTTNSTDIDEHVSSTKVVTQSTGVNNTTYTDEHLSSTNIITEPIEVNNTTYTDEHLSSTKVVTQSIDVNNATCIDEHQSSTKVINDSERWNSRYFGEEPPRNVDDNGQLSIFFDHSYEVPDPDDFKSIAEFEAAWSEWKQDELRRQELHNTTNVLETSKKIDKESDVLQVTQFVEDEVQNDVSVQQIPGEPYVLVNSGSSFVEDKVQNDVSVVSVKNEIYVLVEDDATFVEESVQNNASMLLNPHDAEVLRDTERFLNETYKAGRHRKGCLYKFLDKKTLKNRTVVLYPRVEGLRDPDNVKHWRWALNWEEKIDGEWKNRSINIPAGAVCMVIAMQNNYCSVEEIIAFIKRSKVKSDKKGQGKNKK